jgi:cytochrome c553
MSNRRLVNRCLLGAVLAVPSALIGIYSLGFAQEPPSSNFPSEADQRPVLRVAQADADDKPAGGVDLAAMDVPGGMALDPHAEKRKFLGFAASCYSCHTRNTAPPNPDAAPAFQIPGFPRATNDGWALLNEGITWGSQDKHYGSYAVLLNERSKRMAKILKIVDDEGNSAIHRDLRCIACHSGMPIHEMKLDPEHPGRISKSFVKDTRLSFGVSCEGCHGSSGGGTNDDGSEIKGWERAHTSKTEWRYKDPHEKAKEYGYYDVRSPLARTRMCLSCHVGNVQEGRVVTHEMYAAGHPPLPGFDVETFSSQEPQHWRDFHQKSPKMRDEFLEETKGWRTTEWNDSDLHNTRDLLIGSLVNLSEMVKLNANLADADVAVPNGGEDWPTTAEEQWPEFSQFACYACHHDLRAEGWRLHRTPIGVPGRPPLQEWPFVLAKLALDYDAAGNQEIRSLIRKVQEAGVDAPFGNRNALKTLGPKLAAALDQLAAKLEAKNVPDKDAKKLLNMLIELAESETLDYDSARQIVWAFRVIYDEWKAEPIDFEAFYQPKKIDEVPGWYSDRTKLDPVQNVLAGLEDLILVDLRKGRSTIEKVGDAEEDERLVLEWQPEKALPKIGDYDPEALRKKMGELKTLINQ